MPHFARAIIILCVVLMGELVAGQSITVALQPRPCTEAQQGAIERVVSRFSRALIRNDMTTVNRLLTPALRTRARSKQIETLVQRYTHSRSEQAALSFMLVGPDVAGTPTRPMSFRLLPDRLDCYGAHPLMAGIELFYRWPGDALSVVNLVKTAQGWRIRALGLAQV